MARPLDPRIEEIARQVIDSAYKIHRDFGPGLLERTYRLCLAHELTLRGLSVRMEVALPITYEGMHLEGGYRMDLLVDELVVVEVKAVDCLAPIHTAQVLTYLKLSGRRLGILLNFNVVLMKEGMRRIIN